jgi:hypothetical protein
MQQGKKDEASAKKQRAIEVQQKIAEVQQDRARAIAEANLDRKRKLEDAAKAFAEKMAQLNIDQARERADARTDYIRKQADLRKATLDRLNLIKEGLMREFNLTKSGLAAVLALYRQHAQQVVATAQATARAAGSIGGTGTTGTTASGVASKGVQVGTNLNPAFGTKTTSQTTSKPTASGSTPTSGAQPPSFLKPVAIAVQAAQNFLNNLFPGWAGGGISTGPESGHLELLHGNEAIIPLNRLGKNTSGIFGGSGGGAGNGMISIELLLSPDLESRIISNTLNQTAEIVMRTSRAK